MYVDQILNEEFDALIRELEVMHVSLGMKASGDWIASLEKEISSTEASILANDYTKYLVEGRPNGSFPNINAIKKWIVDKRLRFTIPINSLAFLIARKISKKGTKYYQQGGTDLVEGVITEERIKKITARLNNGLVTEITQLMKV